MIKPHFDIGKYWKYHEVYCGDVTVSFFIDIRWPASERALVYKAHEERALRKWRGE